MRTLCFLSCFAPCLLALTGCAGTSSFVHSDATLGRVVVYRNGIAYFERTAHLEGDSLRLAVPADKVDDFLKSLTVVDAKTGEPAPIAYPTSGQPNESGLIDMKIALTGPTSHDLRLSYVTEAPSWKPSYRLVLGKDGKVNVQAWAIVDNTSGEDWQNVQLGVGSSSALSFRFDLRSVRLVQRETLQQTDLFAQAPPTGGAAYAQQVQNPAQPPAPPAKRMVVELSEEALQAASTNRNAQEEKVAGNRKEAYKAPPPAKPAEARAFRGAEAGAHSSSAKFRALDASSGYSSPPAASPPADKPAVQAQVNQLDAMARTIQQTNKNFVVEGYADGKDNDKYAASLERANRAREQLIRSGVDPNRVVAVGSGEKAGHKGGVSIVEAVAPVSDRDGDGTPDVLVQKQAQALGTDPIGTSHFESKARMTVPRGTSAMVSILSTDTAGEVVYYFDAESPRGNGTYPFRAVRVKNPTDSVLEQGPVTVFGEGKFIGEGMSEPIPARSMAFIPFALDRQIVVERKDADVDRIARIITVQRGVFSTEVQHTRRATFVLNNRLGERATVYVRHTVAQGYKLTKAPSQGERLGAAHLFRVDVEPGAKAEIVIEESTPLFKSTDIRSPSGMEMVTAYLSSEAASGPLKSAMGHLLELHREMANTEQQIATTREQMEEYRARMDELHAQIVTLKAVKTAGPLMTSLEKKLQEVSDKLSKAMIDLVALQEKLMVARIKFQDGVADLTLEKKTEPSPPTKS
jgi:outer membrane protein OmpA-like peptidoglycan-associated protein